MKTDLIERLQHCIVSEAPGSWRKETMREAADRLAALETEASEGERLRALLADIHRTSPKPFRLDRPGLTHGQAAEIGYGALRDAIQTRVAVALIPEEPAREGWQPIETAPKDGTNVIVAEPDGNVTIARWLDRDESWWELNNDSTDCWGVALNPTHWRPLPPPPSQDREPDSQRGAK